VHARENAPHKGYKDWPDNKECLEVEVQGHAWTTDIILRIAGVGLGPIPNLAPLTWAGSWLVDSASLSPFVGLVDNTLVGRLSAAEVNDPDNSNDHDNHNNGGNENDGVPVREEALAIVEGIA